MTVDKGHCEAHYRAFRAALRTWFLEHQRDLPWRSERTLYRTVVSEFMLQQTQVVTMLPYFDRWMERFPCFDSLAHAEEEEVVKYWEGLGYYSRARNLHKLAKSLVARDETPIDAESWELLPGIGPYTAAAITSITFAYPAAVVDGNVVRILTRILADETHYPSAGKAVTTLRPRAQELLCEEDPGLHNEAMMELGATICHKRNPLCTVCPVYCYCESGQRGDPESLPAMKREKQKQMSIQRLWITNDDGALLLELSSVGGNNTIYELPNAKNLKQKPKDSKHLATYKRGIGNTLYTESIYNHSAVEDINTKTHIWADANQLEELTLSGPHRRWIRELQKSEVSS